MRRLFTLSAATTMLAAALVSPVSAATTEGSWAQYPTGAPQYLAEIQQPINSANTSNWSAKGKGGIPVMYKLSSGIGPAVFQSYYSDNLTEPNSGAPCAGGRANDCAFASFTPSTSLTFDEIGTLSAVYAFATGNCHGGSLRWSVRVSATQSVFIYYGDYPNFSDCTTNSQSGENVMAMTDLRFDTTQVGGTFYDDYAGASALVGSNAVIRVSLVIDSGWAGDQVLQVSDITVNDNTYQWNTGGDGTLSPTCDLPDAFIDVTRVSPTPDGAVNETTVYPQSSSNTDDQFRVVDCKYQYVLAIPSLPGTGTYDVEMVINGSPVDTDPGPAEGEVQFDLK